MLLRLRSPVTGRSKVLFSLDQQIERAVSTTPAIQRLRELRDIVEADEETAESALLAQWFARVRGDLVYTPLHWLDTSDFSLWIFDETVPQNISIGVFVDYPTGVPLGQYKAYLRAMLQEHIVVNHPYVCVQLIDETPDLAASVLFTIYCTQ